MPTTLLTFQISQTFLNAFVLGRTSLSQTCSLLSPTLHLPIYLIPHLCRCFSFTQCLTISLACRSHQITIVVILLIPLSECPSSLVVSLALKPRYQACRLGAPLLLVQPPWHPSWTASLAFQTLRSSGGLTSQQCKGSHFKYELFLCIAHFWKSREILNFRLFEIQIHRQRPPHNTKDLIEIFCEHP